jgi:hypothetical protein
VSADNGIYTIKTPKGDGFEFRVAHIQGFESIEWSDTEPNPNGGFGWYTQDPDVLIKNARIIYEHVPVFTVEKEALEEAFRLQAEMGYTEYGICFLEIPREF